MPGKRKRIFRKSSVSDLLLNKSSGDLVAGTYGRGVWRKNLGAGDCVDFTDLTIDSFLDWNGSPGCFNITVTSGGTLNITGA